MPATTDCEKQNLTDDETQLRVQQSCFLATGTSFTTSFFGGAALALPLVFKASGLRRLKPGPAWWRVHNYFHLSFSWRFIRWNLTNLLGQRKKQFHSYSARGDTCVPFVGKGVGMALPYHQTPGSLLIVDSQVAFARAVLESKPCFPMAEPSCVAMWCLKQRARGLRGLW